VESVRLGLRQIATSSARDSRIDTGEKENLYSVGPYVPFNFLFLLHWSLLGQTVAEENMEVQEET